MPRLFIALEIPNSVQSALAEVPKSEVWPSKARAVKLENIHLTLSFLGERPEEKLGEYGEMLQRICAAHPVLQLAAQGVGAFPSVKRARTIWTGVTGDLDALAALQREIEVAFAEGEPENRFVPHLTLARLKQPEAVQKLFGAFREREFGSWTAERVVLMQSELKPAGPIYSVLSAGALGG